MRNTLPFKHTSPIDRFPRKHTRSPPKLANTAAAENLSHKSFFMKGRLETIKKIAISLVLALVTILTLFSTTSFADSAADYTVTVNTSNYYGILAVADGVVVGSGWTNARGYYVAVYHDSLKLTTVYQHILFSSSLKAGQSVVGGKTVIGKVGGTGYSTGSRLYRIVTSKQINWIKC